VLPHPWFSLQGRGKRRGREGEEKWTKGKTPGLRYRQFNKATKETLRLLILVLMAIIIVIMNMH